MDLSDPSPMVNGALMRRFHHQKVKTVLKILNRDGGNIIGQLPDGTPVTLKPLQGSTFSDQFVEVVGIVEGEAMIREESSTSFGNNFDMGSFNQLCQLANGEYKSLFY